MIGMIEINKQIRALLQEQKSRSALAIVANEAFNSKNDSMVNNWSFILFIWQIYHHFAVISLFIFVRIWIDVFQWFIT